MRLEAERARELFASSRIARLATVGPDGAPNLVPVTFAMRDDTVTLAVDHKPKSTRELRRLRDIRHEPRVCLLADHYDDDWTRLWWARADGRARVVPHDPVAAGWLTERYAQYREHPPAGPFIVIEVDRWTGWAYTEG